MNQTNDNKSSKFNNFIVQGGILAVAGVIVRMLGLAKRIPLRYIIGDVGNSYYSAAYEVYNIVLTVAVYGIPLSVSKLVSARVGKGQYRNANKIFKCALSFALVMGTLSSVLVFIFSRQLSSFVNEPMSYLALRVLSPTLFIVAVMAVFRGYFQGMGTMVPTATSQLLEQVVLVSVSLTAAYYLSGRGEKVGLILHNPLYKNAYGAAGATLGCAVGAGCALIFLIFLYRAYKKRIDKKIYRDPSTQIEDTFEVYKILILTIIPVVISSTVNNISNIIDMSIYNAHMVSKGLTDIKSVHWGIYAGMYLVLIGVPIAISSAMGASSVPTIAAVMRRDEYDSASEKIGNVIRITMMIAIPCAAGMIALAPSIIWTIFSDNSEVASNLLRIGSAGIVLFSFSTLTNGILQGMSRLIKPITHGLIALALHVTILFTLLNTTNMGIYAVAFSNNFFSLFICIMNIASISRELKYRQEIKYTFIMPIISASVMGITIYTLDWLFTNIRGGFSRSLTVVNILIGVFIYFFIMIISKGITKKELMAMPGGTRLYGILHKIHIM